jgi:hypothetical protein
MPQATHPYDPKTMNFCVLMELGMPEVPIFKLTPPKTETKKIVKVEKKDTSKLTYK